MKAQAQPHCTAEAQAIPVSEDEMLTATRARIAEEKAAYTKPTFTFDELLEYVMGGELGDARLFIRLNAEKLSYDHAGGQWYEFSGHFWKEDETDNTLAKLDELMDLYTGLARKIYNQMLAATKAGNKEVAQELKAVEALIRKKIGLLQRRRHRENVLVLAAAGASSLGITGREWDSNPYLLPFLNGVLDLSTLTFRPGQPDDFIKTVCPIDWLGFNTPAPKWERFISDIMAGDVEKIQYLKRLLGSALPGEVVDHIIPILWGKNGRNGKSVLLEILGIVLGPLAGPIQAELLLAQKYPRSSAAPSPDVMALRGKRLVWASEIDEGRKINAGKIKWLTGADTLIGRSPFARREVTFKPSHTLLMITNFRPVVNPEDGALWERIHLIEFRVRFLDNPNGENQRLRNPNIANELKEEAAGIMAWLLAGYIERKKKGLAPPASVLTATEEYKQEEDSIKQFIKEMCLVGDGKIARASELYESYTAFCEDCGLKPKGKKKFFQALSEEYLKDRDNKGVYYTGLGLKDLN
jgi:putative DNA primase/helicase